MNRRTTLAALVPAALLLAWLGGCQSVVPAGNVVAPARAPLIGITSTVRQGRLVVGEGYVRAVREAGAVGDVLFSWDAIVDAPELRAALVADGHEQDATAEEPPADD